MLLSEALQQINVTAVRRTMSLDDPLAHDEEAPLQCRSEYVENRVKQAGVVAIQYWPPFMGDG